MTLYITILLIFLYFKIARVHKKEEKLTLFWKIQHIVVFIVAIFTYIYAFKHMELYLLVLLSFLSFIVSAMIITAIQLGIFIDGKPLFGMKKVYDSTIYLTAILCCLSIILWIV